MRARAVEVDDVRVEGIDLIVHDSDGMRRWLTGAEEGAHTDGETARANAETARADALQRRLDELESATACDS